MQGEPLTQENCTCRELSKGTIGLPGTNDPLKVKEYRIFICIRIK